MSYLALYRKYRPKSFSEVVGQDVVINILKNSIKNNKIGHAYIFSGTKGTGKTSVAKIYAKAINCLCPTDGDLCNNCQVCLNLNENSIDIIEIDAASNNGVEEIREIRNNVKIMPNYCKYKVYIIDEVHMLSTSAFNALLKTLEEPPEHVVFILATTELNKIPSTVLSRCQKLDFKKISKPAIVRQLKYILSNENKILDDNVLNLIAEMSDGAFRDAINLMDQLLTLNKDNVTVDDIYNIVGIVPSDIAFNFISFIMNADIKNGLILINDFFNKGVNFYSVCQKLELIINDIIIFNTTDNYFNDEYESTLDNFVFKDIDKCFDLANIIYEMSGTLKKCLNQKSLFETYFIKMCLIFKKSENSNMFDVGIVHEKIKDNSDNKIASLIDVPLISECDKNIRINNTLALANKSLKKEFVNKFKMIDNFYSNLEYSSIIKLLTKSIPEVVSDKNVIFVLKNNFEVVLFDKNIFLVEKLIKEVFGKSYVIVSIDENKWKIIKEKYVNDIKNGIIYKYIDETAVKKSNGKISALENDAANLFGESVVSE